MNELLGIRCMSILLVEVQCSVLEVGVFVVECFNGKVG